MRRKTEQAQSEDGTGPYGEKSDGRGKSARDVSKGGDPLSRTDGTEDW